MLEADSHKILCACDPCATRFESVVAGRFRLIPRDARGLPDFSLTNERWESLALPINMAFFFRSIAAGGIVAMYPGPDGALEYLLSAEYWKALEEANPALAHIKPEVEALLVNRVDEARDYFVAPIDRCYELAEAIRQRWRGLSGGELVGREISRFFSRLREQAGPVLEFQEASHA